jgi:hypothetical protein
MSFESRLDKFWENQPRKYNYSHEIVINTTGHDLSITRLDEELTEEVSCGDLVRRGSVSIISVLSRLNGMSHFSDQNSNFNRVMIYN